MFKSSIKISACFLAVVFLYFSCATTVPVKVTRPAELDLGGAKTIAVLPVGAPSDITRDMSYFEILIARKLGLIKTKDTVDARVAARLTQLLTNGLIKAPYFTVVNDKDVSSFIQSPSGEPPAQVYLTGEITKFETGVDSRVEKRKKGKDNFEVTTWTRSVSLDLTYKVIDARSKNILSFKTRSISTVTASCDSQDELPTADAAVSSQLESLASGILREIQPYDVTLYLTLLADEAKDPAMKDADKLVNDGLILKAFEAFSTIYKSTKNFAAGYNAAWLQVALGNLEAARELMQALADASADKRAFQAVKDIDAEIASSKKLSQQLGN